MVITVFVAGTHTELETVVAVVMKLNSASEVKFWPAVSLGIDVILGAKTKKNKF